jgi:hypothetical protein
MSRRCSAAVTDHDGRPLEINGSAARDLCSRRARWRNRLLVSGREVDAITATVDLTRPDAVSEKAVMMGRISTSARMTYDICRKVSPPACTGRALAQAEMSSITRATARPVDAGIRPRRREVDKIAQRRPQGRLDQSLGVAQPFTAFRSKMNRCGHRHPGARGISIRALLGDSALDRGCRHRDCRHARSGQAERRPSRQESCHRRRIGGHGLRSMPSGRIDAHQQRALMAR